MKLIIPEIYGTIKLRIIYVRGGSAPTSVDVGCIHFLCGGVVGSII